MTEVYKITSGLEKEEAGVFKGRQSQTHNKKWCIFYAADSGSVELPVRGFFGCSKFTQAQGGTRQVLENGSLLQEGGLCVTSVTEQKSHPAQKTPELKPTEGGRVLWGKYLMWSSCSYSSLIVCS